MHHLLELVHRVAAALRQVAQRNDHRRLADDPVSPVDELGELRERLHAVARVRLPCCLLRVLLSGRRLLPVGTLRGADRCVERGEQVLLGQVRVPDVHRAHLGELGHRLSIRLRRRERRGATVGLAEPVVPRRDREARRHPLHVVLERSGQRLVEVVEVEHELPLRRCEHAEVREVRVAAELHVEPSRRRVLQVGGHDLGRAPVERERRDHHAPVTHRHEIRLTRGVLLFEQRNRVGTTLRRRPSRVARRSAPAHEQTSLVPCDPRHSDA